MKDDVLTHYHDVKDDARQRLRTFKEKPDHDEALFKELTFCVFAANSSADMGMKAVELLEPVLHTGNEEAYKNAVAGKVRFHSVRSEYTAHNHGVLTDLDHALTHRISDAERPRQLIQHLFKGIGWKEASHFLRNTGHEGYCILDKHVRSIMHDIGVHKDTDYPNTLNDYREKEQRMQAFCDKHGLDVDILDLALWSYKTGYIAK